ncbi:hypothetical protein DUNSADRAFT_14705 [Dunaliella salina]|uniref:G-patch domain-containing protein n=1 Tax=Dunaliella salina TaxID=3046 RepID=A0ABQ7G6V8_DUNSA|nr:hypothetical protein DUNSADRAFT_14705 [Dunaliella salina]KAF5830344.1 hypothetical protein DUNSADRAFT_14705 [Dunaliella salina]|eukprot:KAF5830342.1 hypothetical protein DUNSADRAFT_14705 [Dunaliella salina]
MSEGDDDELEALLDQYAQQASREKEESESRQRKAAAKGRAPSAAARLASGLSKPLTQDNNNNKGLKMMQSMGYQVGKGLGAQGQGPTAPVAIDIRGKRTGLGVDEAKRARKAQQQQEAHERQVKRAKLEAASATAFQDATRTGFAARRMLEHLHGAMSSLEQLLESAQFQHQGEEHPKHEHRQVEIFPQLTALFPRLLTGGHIEERDIHQALAQVPKAEELFAKMQGSSKGDRNLGWAGWLDRASKSSSGISTKSASNGASEEPPQSEATLAAEAIAEAAKGDPSALASQLHALLHVLRTHFSYCFWCGARYDSVEQLLGSCPGECEDDH